MPSTSGACASVTANTERGPAPRPGRSSRTAAARTRRSHPPSTRPASARSGRWAAAGKCRSRAIHHADPALRARRRTARGGRKAHEPARPVGADGGQRRAATTVIDADAHVALRDGKVRLVLRAVGRRDRGVGATTALDGSDDHGETVAVLLAARVVVREHDGIAGRARAAAGCEEAESEGGERDSLELHASSRSNTRTAPVLCQSG